MDIDLSELTQIIDVDLCRGIDQSARRGDDEHAAKSIWATRERIRVSDLSPKIKSAQEGKDLGDGCAFFAPQSFREIELRAVA